MKNILIPFAAAACVPLFFWLGGYDFNERGHDAVACLFLAITVAVLTRVALKLKESP